MWKYLGGELGNIMSLIKCTYYQENKYDVFINIV